MNQKITLILIRHAKKNVDALTPEGIARALELQQQLRDVAFTHAVSTEFQRAQQMRDLVLGQKTATVSTVADYLSNDPKDPILAKWVEVIEKAGGSHDFVRIAEVDSDCDDFMKQQSDRCAGILHALCLKNGPESVTLFIGHAPMNDVAVLGLTGQFVAPFKEGEGIELVLECPPGWEHHTAFRIERQFRL